MNEKEIRQFLSMAPLDDLLKAASSLRDKGHGANVSYSRKVFVPLTQLCRNFCHYCTFAQPPKKLLSAYLSPEEVLEVVRAGEKAGCHEVLFTLGDKPEFRYEEARNELKKLNHSTTISYLAEICALVLKETSLLPHVNPGVMTREEMAMLRKVSVSQGIMLENVSPRLMTPGQVHYGSPDKNPAARLETIRMAGELKIPFTSGILIGIGETREERLDSLFALRELHLQYGHLQEILVQNFRAKPLTRMAKAAEPDLADHLWSIAAARLIFGAEMNIQVPPNLTPDSYPLLLQAGLNDWGGISPVTKDFVNPEAPWPHIDHLRKHTEANGKVLVERLASYPYYCKHAHAWHEPTIAARVLALVDSEGFVRMDQWTVGSLATPPIEKSSSTVEPAVQSILDKLQAQRPVNEEEIMILFRARSGSFSAICQAANELRKSVCGDEITYVVNRNINYTNVCYFKCQFCAFSKGKFSENLRGKPYNLDLAEVKRRTKEAFDRGATEVCMQGGIHPEYTGETYLNLCRAVKEVAPEIHIHAFSPLEIWMGAKTLGLSLHDYLLQAKEAGLGTLPGTAAEILDDEVRALLCPDKINTRQWLEVIEAAHAAHIRTTSTMMFGHMEETKSWARHLLHLRALQEKTGGITEFVPLPFVHMEAPIFLKGKARKGPTWRETVLMHAIARLVLHPLITNIQVSWVKLGPEGSKACLEAGANDLGGTLMNESISRAAGTAHGQEMPPHEMEALIRSIGRKPKQRTTLYKEPPALQQQRSYQAPPLEPVVLTPLRSCQR